MTSQACSCLCPSMAVSVSLSSSTIDKRHPHHSHYGVRQHERVQCIQNTIWWVDRKGLQTKVEHHGQSSNMTHQKNPYQKQLQIASHWTPQSSSECCQASNSNIQSGIQSCFANYRQQVPTIVGQIYPQGPGHPQHVVHVANWSHSVGIWNFEQRTWLEKITTCPAWVQGNGVQRLGHLWLRGILRCRCLLS